MAIINGFSTGDSIIVEQLTISAAQAAAKQVALSETPNPAKIILDVQGGPSQYVGTDYAVIGNLIDWNAKTLETILQTGDVLRVLYVKN